MDSQIVALIAGVTLVSGALFGYRYTTSRVLRRHFHNREKTPASGFGRHFYPADPANAEVASFIVERMQYLAGYDYTGAVPQDRINKDLKLDEIDSLANAELLAQLEERFGIRVTDADAEKIATIDELVQLVNARRGTNRA